MSTSKYYYFPVSYLFPLSLQPVTIGQRKLSLPERTKQFLISPPASPPVGWEPISEDPPTVDYNLIAALSQLRKPGNLYQKQAINHDRHYI